MQVEEESGTVYTIANEINVANAVDPRSASISDYATTAASVAARAAAHTKMTVDVARSASSWFSRILDRDESFN